MEKNLPENSKITPNVENSVSNGEFLYHLRVCKTFIYGHQDFDSEVSSLFQKFQRKVLQEISCYGKPKYTKDQTILSFLKKSGN